MTSSVPAFKAALAARLTEDTALAGVMVNWGNPHPKRMPGEVVLIGPTKDRDLQYMGSMSQANETYAVDVLVSVIGAVQKTQETLLSRCYEIADAINDSVLAWKDSDYDGLSILVVPGQSSDDEAIDAEGKFREATITQAFHVTARI